MPSKFDEMQEQEICELIDKKVKPIKKELQQLKKAHDGVAAQQHQALLKTQRGLAHLMIIYASNNGIHVAYEQNPQIAQSIATQLTAQAAIAATKASTSEDPLSVATQFDNECSKCLKGLGIHFIDLPF